MVKQQVLPDPERTFVSIKIPPTTSHDVFFGILLGELQNMHGIYAFGRCDPQLVFKNDPFVVSVKTTGLADFLSTVPFTGAQAAKTSPFLVNLC
jgi:hypothetical protein